MDNAAEGLKIGFALIVFAVALTALFMLVSGSRATADIVFNYSDRTSFYNNPYRATGVNRVVNVSDVISTLYRYYNESVEVDVILNEPRSGFPTTTYIFDIGRETVVDSSGDPVSPKPSEEYLNTITLKEKNLGDFINNKLINYPDKTFTETFVEVPTDGIYLYEDDGTELTIVSGSKKVLITYTEI
jgi:hypothetical protein